MVNTDSIKFIICHSKSAIQTLVFSFCVVIIWSFVFMALALDIAGFAS
jgi:hypothetical protein